MPAPVKGRWVKFVGSLAVTGACLWWTFKDTNWPQMWAALASANYWMTLPYLVVLLLIHVMRTLRWGNLLSGLERVPFARLNEAAAVGFMMLIILPFRLGEFARPLLVAQRSGIRRSAAMTSVVLERIIDGIVVALLLRGLLFFLPGDTGELSKIRIGANLMFSVFFGGFVFLVLARWQQARVNWLLRGTIGRVAPRAADRLIHIVEGFVGALRQLPDARNLTLFVIFTIAYWTLNGVGIAVLASAFDCASASGRVCLPLQLDLFQSFVVLCVLVVGVMIPAAPGSAGTFQAFVLLALAVFLPRDVVNGSGVAFANTLWVMQMGQQVLTGMVFMLLSRNSFADITGKLSAESPETA